MCTRAQRLAPAGLSDKCLSSNVEMTRAYYGYQGDPGTGYYCYSNDW